MTDTDTFFERNIRQNWRTLCLWWRTFSFIMPFPWSSLKTAMSSKFARLTFIVPIIGWLLVYNDNLATILEQKWQISIDEGTSWKLYAFYLGLFAIAVSSIVYAVFCPKEVKRFDSEVDFVKTARLIFTESYSREVSAQVGRLPFVWAPPAPETKNPASGKFPLVRKHTENEEELVDLLVAHYRDRDMTWPLVRILAFLIFLVGVVMTSIPTLSTVGWASCRFVEDAGDHFWLEKVQNACTPELNSTEDHLENVE